MTKYSGPLLRDKTVVISGAIHTSLHTRACNLLELVQVMHRNIWGIYTKSIHEYDALLINIHF